MCVCGVGSGRKVAGGNSKEHGQVWAGQKGKNQRGSEGKKFSLAWVGEESAWGGVV